MYRLIYKSRGTIDISWNVIKDILHASEANNELAEITGFLLASQTHFLQVIEGRFEDVNSTFMRIVRDPRHTEVRLLSYEVVDARLFDGWSMKGLGIFDLNQDAAAQLKRKYGTEEGGVRFPLEGWLALAMIHDVRSIDNLPDWKK
jgi:hypothetical protein